MKIEEEIFDERKTADFHRLAAGVDRGAGCTDSLNNGGLKKPIYNYTGENEMEIKTNTFAAACYDQNTIDELVHALAGEADETDCKTWGLDENSWAKQIQIALKYLTQEKVKMTVPNNQQVALPPRAGDRK